MHLLRGDDVAYVVVCEAPVVPPAQWNVFGEVRDMGGGLAATQPRCQWVIGAQPDAIQLYWTREDTQALKAGQYKFALRFERIEDGYIKTSSALVLTVRERL